MTAISIDPNTLLVIMANLTVIAIAWGTHRADMRNLRKDHEVLVDRVNKLSDLKLKVERIDTRQDMLIENIKDLKASIRWMSVRGLPIHPDGELEQGVGG